MADKASSIVECVLSLAAQEAGKAGYAEITPAHLLIALSRASEASEGGSQQNATTEIRAEFEHFGIEPRLFRRRLRAVLGARQGPPAAGIMHRSASCRAVFAIAEAFAAQDGLPFSGAHLVRAGFAWLGAHQIPEGGQVPAKNETPADDIPTEL